MQSLGTLTNNQILKVSRVVVLSLPANSPEDVLNGRDKQEFAAENGFRTVAELNKSVSLFTEFG